MKTLLDYLDAPVLFKENDTAAYTLQQIMAELGLGESGATKKVRNLKKRGLVIVGKKMVNGKWANAYKLKETTK